MPATTSTQVVALYCRLSPRPDGSYDGVDRQEAWGRAYAAETWPGVPIEVFPDEGITAARDDVLRPGYERLKRRIEDGRVKAVWTVEQSRISRTIKWFDFVDLCELAGIHDLHTEDEGVVKLDSDQADYGAVRSRREAKKVKQRTLRHVKAKARQGEPGGALPYGFARGTLPNDTDARKPIKTYVIVEEQATIIRECAQRVLEGWSLLRIANDLKTRGVRSTYGGPMVGSVIRRWLTNAAVAGKRRHHDQLYAGNWPAILDKDTWDSMLAILGNPRTVQCTNGATYQVGDRTKYRSTSAKRYLLTGGLAVCGECSAQLIGHTKIRVQTARGVTRRTSTPYLMCSKARGGQGCIAAQLLPVEEYVIEQMFAELDDPDFLARVSTDDSAERRAELMAALTALDARRRKLAGRYALDEISDDDWDTMQATLGGREHELRRELDAVPIAPPTFDVAAIRELWDSEDATLDERRAIIRRLVAKVTIKKGRPGLRRFDPGRVDIKWRYPNTNIGIEAAA